MRRKLFWSAFVALSCMIIVCVLLFVGIFFTFYADVPDTGALPWLIIGIVFLVLLAGLLAVQITKLVITPFSKINLNSPTENTIYPELQPMIDRINEQRHQLDIQVEELTLEHDRQDKLRREFTANVSHELKTPLTSISGYAEIMKNGMVDAEHVTLFSERIHNESRRLITLVEDIIKLSQLEGKELPYSLMEIDLYDTAAAILERLSAVAERNHIPFALRASTVKLSVPGGLLMR